MESFVTYLQNKQTKNLCEFPSLTISTTIFPLNVKGAVLWIATHKIQSGGSTEILA